MTDAPSLDAPLIDHASWLADLGRTSGAFKVFPVVPNAKHPRAKGWQADASNDRKTVEAMWINEPDSNIGLAIQPGFVVLDLDIYKPGNDTLLKEFEREFGALPETMEFRTASGGRHLVYSTPRIFGNGKGTLPGFGDVRGFGGLIVGPGSVFNGNRYTVVDTDAPTPLPDAVDSRLIARRFATSPTEKVCPQFVELDDPKNIERYATWLQGEAKLGTAGVDRNNMMAATAAMGASFALSEDMTVALMVEHWEPRLDVPLTPDHIAKHGGSGYRSAWSRFGNMASPDPKLMFKVVEDTGKTASGHGFINLDELLKRQPIKRQWAWGTDDNGWMPLRKLTTLYGPGGVGKSALMLQIVEAFSRGAELFGAPTQAMPVLLLSCEEDEDELLIRLKAQGVTGGGGKPVYIAAVVEHDASLHHPARSYATTPPPAEDTTMWRFVDDKLAALGAGDKLLVLDNLGELFSGNYMDTVEVRKFLKHSLGRLLTKHTATCLLLAHPAESQKDNGEGSFGSAAWSSGVRSRLYFDWPRINKGQAKGDVTNLKMRVLSRRKANYSTTHEKGAGLVLEFRDWKFWQVEMPPADAKPMFKPVDSKHLLDIFRRSLEDYAEKTSGIGHTERDLATTLTFNLAREGNVGFTIESVKVYLKKLIEEGHKYYDPSQYRTKWVCKRAPVSETLH